MPFTPRGHRGAYQVDHTPSHGDRFEPGTGVRHVHALDVDAGISLRCEQCRSDRQETDLGALAWPHIGIRRCLSELQGGGGSPAAPPAPPNSGVPRSQLVTQHPPSGSRRTCSWARTTKPVFRRRLTDAPDQKPRGSRCPRRQLHLRRLVSVLAVQSLARTALGDRLSQPAHARRYSRRALPGGRPSRPRPRSHYTMALFSVRRRALVGCQRISGQTGGTLGVRGRPAMGPLRICLIRRSR